MQWDDIQQTSIFFNALSNETRLRIVILVRETRRPLHIKAIALVVDYSVLYCQLEVLQRSCGSDQIGIFNGFCTRFYALERLFTQHG
jgi:hypothetical protein